MAFTSTVNLKNCPFIYEIDPKIKKYTLLDNTFFQNKLGNFELSRLLEEVPNSGEGFLLKIIINKDLKGFKINITDKSGLRLIDIFKPGANPVIQQKFFFLMDSLAERDVFNKIEK